MTPTIVQPFLVDSLVALFDDGLEAPAVDGPLPPYWHLAACAAPPRSGDLGADGHPVTATVTAPAELPRRMFAGGTLRIHRPLRVGETTEIEESVVATVDKTGRSGRLRFVTVDAQFRGADGDLALSEQRTIVYREAVTPDPAGLGRSPSPAGPSQAWSGGSPLRLGKDGDAVLQPDSVALQRFSAVTSNAHRIHFDHPYVTQVEGYRGLVVHGPLVLLSLLELARKVAGGRTVSAVTFAASAPAFVDDVIDLRATEVGRATLELRAMVGTITVMTATVTLG